MALTKEGLFSCGINRFGKLGLGSYNYEQRIYSFTKINLQNVITVECGGNHSLALTTNGLYACGSAIAIRPFANTELSSFQKGDIQNIVSFKCGHDFSLILTHKGLYGCGKNNFGQLGYINKDSYSYSKEFIKIDIDNVLSFDCGKFHSIIETTEGFFGCGSNHKGQLGIDNYNKSKNKLVKIM